MFLGNEDTTTFTARDIRQALAERLEFWELMGDNASKNVVETVVWALGDILVEKDHRTQAERLEFVRYLLTGKG